MGPAGFHLATKEPALVHTLPSPLRQILPIAAAVVMACALAPILLTAQEGSIGTEEGWNSQEALDLVDRGREARGTLAADGELATYRALIEGNIYFYLDPDEGERALIRVDQVAVEVRWRAPDRVQHHLLGERSETRLPVQDFRYYLDRMTLLHYGFDDEIRIGQGRDVAGVPHPLGRHAAGAPLPYDYRVTSSVSISLPGREIPLRLHTLEVRPRDLNAPGIFGTITLDAETAQIVRMAITFTPASYVDPRTDRISAELDYGLQEGKYWLPNLQRIEVRREIPELDIGVGTVIQSVLRTGDYELNAPLPESFAVLPPFTAAPLPARASYPFPDDLYSGLDRDGLAEVRVETDLAQLREEAVNRIRASTPSGLSPIRFHLPRLSSAIRYSRGEGLYLGVGGSIVPTPRMQIRGSLGAAFGTRDLQLAGQVGFDLLPGWRGEVEVHRGILEDLGLAPGIDGLFSTLSTLSRGEDYRDPYRTSGAGLRLTLPGGESSTAWIGGGVQRVENAALGGESAPFDGDRRFRPIRSVTKGTFGVLEGGVRRSIPWPGGGRGWGEFSGEVIGGSAGRGGSLATSLDARWGPLSEEREIQATVNGWHWVGDPLRQGQRLLGGRGTLPGYPYHSFSGESALAASLIGSVDLWVPLLRVRGGVHAGWSDGGSPQVLAEWGTRGTEGVRSSATLGLGFGWDLLRLDLARGFSGDGEWQVMVSIDPRWWPRL